MGMTLEELIYQRLATADALKNRLALFGGSPAVFYQKAPEDTAEGWEGGRHYPRIDFVVNTRADPERRTAGTVALHIFCGEDSPEELEPEVRAVLDGRFLQPDAAPAFGIAWVRSDAFEQSKIRRPTPLVTGLRLRFELYAFPVEWTLEPDPVAAIGQYVRKRIPGAFLIGTDAMEGSFAATGKRPAFYFRLLSVQTARETNTAVWMDGVLAGHVFPPEAAGRLRQVADCLSLDGEVPMGDGSPMLIRRVKTDAGADALSAGQLRVHIHFGLLRKPKAVPLLMHAHLSPEKQSG